MGAVCGRPKKGVASKDPQAANDSQTAVQKQQTAVGANAGAGTAEAGAKVSPHPAVAAQSSLPVTRNAARIDEFKPGDGDGVYLLEATEGHVSLVSQYAHDKPTDQGIVLLQVKAPPYRPIPESRFVLQSGKRILRQNIDMMKDTTEAKTKYCEVVMEFIRLAATYNGFLWASTHLGEIKQPFSIFYLESRQKAAPEPEAPVAEIKNTLPIGKDALEKKKAATGENDTKKEGEQNESGENDTKKEGEQGAPGNAPAAESEQAPKTKNEIVVKFLGPECSVSHRLLATCGILPLSLDKAKELIPEDKQVNNVDEIKTIVTEAGGFFVSPAAA
ncbi:conserved hypothetical protein [Neospora caninum Liverpool]|uniref:Immune mapped protein 2 N-terminal domain-containing protein n=1 Tax=Neospora caninum (strain Liverpool) TaxID=572307 RepID=F0VI79_NEOCL|nr:conserved hypothetical protein [Neospora caninum Liverpool]CBZ53440.1 conserved hypothetical protein [Neospora caninum Liverpool]CEL67427.1 TPA: hypothetical protein BN1204_032270 [Neospora caninum Liverpool]|eukprot:XP_003883472.1 conserved hypothetical protein [Neospora caninum Liverpool]